MVRTTRLLLVCAALGAAVSRGPAQPFPLTPPPRPREEGRIKGGTNIPPLPQPSPHPRDDPASLYQPAPPPMPPPPLADRPYFQVDPSLDRPEFPQPGCFLEVELG